MKEAPEDKPKDIAVFIPPSIDEEDREDIPELVKDSNEGNSQFESIEVTILNLSLLPFTWAQSLAMKCS